jgi:hypothetical protein
VRSHARDRRVGVPPGQLELDVAVEVLEAPLARQLELDAGRRVARDVSSNLT